MPKTHFNHLPLKLTQSPPIPLPLPLAVLPNQEINFATDYLMNYVSSQQPKLKETLSPPHPPAPL